MKEKDELPRITKILSVEPFKITAQWSTDEIRQIDFAPFFDQWEKEANLSLLRLRDFNKFKMAEVTSSQTLSWPSVIATVKLRNRILAAPLDLDPDVLYESSTFIRRESAAVGSIIRRARIAAGLSQAQVATRSGTTRNYISRIENGKSDIQLETLKKIVQLGLGKSILVDIV